MLCMDESQRDQTDYYLENSDKVTKIDELRRRRSDTCNCSLRFE